MSCLRLLGLSQGYGVGVGVGRSMVVETACLQPIGQNINVDHMWLQKGMFLLGCRHGCSGRAWFLGSACNQTDVNRIIPSMLATCIGEGP